MKIVIEGTPQQQKRMRYSSRNQFVRVYDPVHKEKKDVRTFLQHLIRQEYPDFQLFQHPQVAFIFFMPIPKSLSKKQIARMQDNNIRHEKKPDVDNLIKFYLDCLDGILFQGDQAVSIKGAIKVYSAEPKTMININETDEQVPLTELHHLVFP